MEKRELPALPSSDSKLGEIRWDRWEPALIITHYDPSCETCAFPGPLSTCYGSTWYQPPLRRRITRRSNIAQGVRPAGVVERPKPYWCKSHWAYRCPACDEMKVYRAWPSTAEMVEIFYNPPRTKGEVSVDKPRLV